RLLVLCSCPAPRSSYLGFQEVGDITGAQTAIQDAGNLLERATVQGLTKRAKPLAGLTFFQNIRHGTTCGQKTVRPARGFALLVRDRKSTRLNSSHVTIS